MLISITSAVLVVAFFHLTETGPNIIEIVKLLKATNDCRMGSKDGCCSMAEMTGLADCCKETVGFTESVVTDFHKAGLLNSCKHA